MLPKLSSDISLLSISEENVEHQTDDGEDNTTSSKGVDDKNRKKAEG